MSILCLGTYITGILKPELWLWVCFFTCLIIIFVYIYLPYKLIKKILFYGLFLLLLYMFSASQTLYRHNRYNSFSPQKGTHTIIGKVLDAPERKKNKLSFPLKLKNTNHTIVVKIKSPKVIPKYGNLISLTGKYIPPSPPTNPGQFNYKKYLFLKNISGLFYAKKIKVLEKRTGNPFQRIAIYLRKRIQKLNQETLPPPFDKLYTGLVFGDHGAKLPDEIQEQFKKTGLTHLLVVSGSQVSLLSGIILTTVRLMGFKRLTIFSIVTLCNIIFYCLTGGGASIFRAILMNEIALSISLLKRKADIAHVLSVTALIMLLINPLTLFDLGAMLSFLATIALVFGVEPIAKLLPKKWPGFIRNPVAMALAPFLWTSPILWYSFYNISPISILSNLIAVQAIEALVVVGFFSSIIGFAVVPISMILNNFSYLIMILLHKVVSFLVKIPGGIIYVKKPPLMIILGLYLSLIIIIKSLTKHDIKKVKQIGIMSLLITVLWISPSLFPNSTLKITFIDVGQGDATLIQTPYKKNILIDGGVVKRDYKTGEIKSDSGKRYILPLLKYYGINKLDMVITTHFDSDHVGGIPSILENVRIGTLMDNGRTEPYFKRYNRFRENYTKKYIKAESGQVFQLDKETTLTILHPIKNIPYDKKKNNNSIAGIIRYKASSFLFTGDLEKEREYLITQTYGHHLDVDLYKAGHHGSKTSSIQTLLNVVTPEITVISCGRKNRYHHPHPSVMQRLEKMGSKVYRIDTQGAITCSSDGILFSCGAYL